MWLAKSIKYGGQLIKASECDYESYKELGLICPECNNLVFLNKGYSTTNKHGTKINVPPHFNHFKQDLEVAEKCELRVKQYSEREIKKALKEARNQRYKFFQKWFWDCLHRVNKIVLAHYLTPEKYDRVLSESYKKLITHGSLIFSGVRKIAFSI